MFETKNGAFLPAAAVAVLLAAIGTRAQASQAQADASSSLETLSAMTGEPAGSVMDGGLPKRPNLTVAAGSLQVGEGDARADLTPPLVDGTARRAENIPTPKAAPSESKGSHASSAVLLGLLSVGAIVVPGIGVAATALVGGAALASRVTSISDGVPAFFLGAIAAGALAWSVPAVGIAVGVGLALAAVYSGFKAFRGR